VTRFDVAVVGSGFSGSLLALVARRLGRSVVLLERGRHPRFAIGESSSPLANLLLAELAERYDLPRVRPLAAWGSWQRTYPEIGCGLKRGFTFYAHEAGRAFSADPSRRDQLLVAASPFDEVADTHWYRPDFDRFLAMEARDAGAEYLDETETRVVAHGSDGLEIEATGAGTRRRLRARFVVDATGPRGFLHAALGLPASPFPDLPETEGLFAHFEGVRRLDGMEIHTSEEKPPYPVDDAAVHHVFDGGWIWVLRFASGLVSAGVAAEPALARTLRLSEGGPGWTRLLQRFPTVAAQFARARPTVPFVYRSHLPFRTGSAAGPAWALMPSTAAFVDPLLSTGFPLTLLGIERLAAAIAAMDDAAAFTRRIEEHDRLTLFEADTAALLVSALYAAFGDFEVFAALTLLYFAAASYAEAARRLGKPHLSGSFLSGNHSAFGPALERCCRIALDRDPGRREELLGAIRRAIEPFDVIGLAETSRRNWYPVLAEDLVAARHKLGATREEIEGILDAPPAPASVTGVARV
jgi:tetracycline 7-halogenase / FADH2 O2-dependent halogenase